MHYRSQAAFLRRFNFAAAAVAILLLLIEARLQWHGRLRDGAALPVAGWVLTAAAAALAFYVPKYLLLSWNPRARALLWARRIHDFWPLLLPLLAIGSSRRFYQFTTATYSFGTDGIALLVGLALLALALNQYFKRLHRAGRLSPLAYVATDLALLAAAIAIVRPAAALAMPFFVLAIVILEMLLNGAAVWVLAIPAVWLAGASLSRGDLVFIAVLFAIAACLHLLCLGCRRQSASNREATVTLLADFAGAGGAPAPRARIREQMDTAGFDLARNWNAAAPKTEAELRQWYSANAELYIYDLSQFHLLYKHIAYNLLLFPLARGRVLDYGAGTGDVGLELAARGHDVTLLELPGKSQELSRFRAQRANLHPAHVSSDDEVVGRFDTIVSLDVLEHLPDVTAAAARWVEWLNPGGRILATYHPGETAGHPMHLARQVDLAAFFRANGLRSLKPRLPRLWPTRLVLSRDWLLFEKPRSAR
jgi:SAM-dependent methyltransferase